MNKKTKVLIVEDEMSLALLMVNVLSQVGCDTDFAMTGKKAMEKASENRFDLITLNVELPDTTGFEICSELKQRHISCKTPVIFISASPCPEDMEEAKRRGAVDYISKPFDLTELIYKVIYYANVKKPATENEGVVV